MTQAFDDIRILDFTEGIAGQLACGLLAQFGADVIRVEPPHGVRIDSRPGAIAWNCNKRRLLLDLATEGGLEAAFQLVATASVAVFDGAPGRLESLGLDPARLTSLHPGLIHGWLPMFGIAGRWRDVPPEDSLLAAATCISFAQASWDDVPVHLLTPQLSYGHGILAAGAIAAALFERRRSGRGQAVVCSGVHGYGAVRSGGAIRAATMQRLGAGRGSRGGSPNYRLYQCGDGQWLFLATLTMPFFLRALTALDLLDLLAMDGVEGEIANLQRAPTNEEVIQHLDARFAEKTREDWLAILREGGVPAGPVGERMAWFEGEQVAANGMRIELPHPELGIVAVPGVSAKLSETPGRMDAVMSDVTLEELLAGPPATLPPPAGARPAGGPLAGLRVLDLGAVIAGPFGPTVLANYGADVIKVEPPEGDSFRTAALGFAGWNRGKRSIVVDLKAAGGMETFNSLVRSADVVVDNFRLGVTARLGIDYANLRTINPRIITCSVLGFGREGPFRSDPGYDPVLQARSGLMAAQGGDGEPVFHTIPVNDEASGLMSAFAILTALNARERTGRGQEIWTALANQSVVCQSDEVTSYAGRPKALQGGRDCPGVSALHRLYRCGDGWLALACLEPGQFGALARVLNQPLWPERWSDAAARAEPRDGELARLLEGAFGGLPRDSTVAALLAHGVPAVAAITAEEAHDDPWLLANRFWEEYELPGHGLVAGVRSYADFSRTPGGFQRAAPLLGEHTREIVESLFPGGPHGSVLSG